MANPTNVDSATNLLCDHFGLGFMKRPIKQLCPDGYPAVCMHYRRSSVERVLLDETSTESFAKLGCSGLYDKYFTVVFTDKYT